MNSYLRKFFKFLIVFIIISPFYYLIDYDVNSNPDYNNYLSDYRNANWSYEFGYEYLSYISRDVLGLDFEFFWQGLIFIQLFLLAVIYRRGAVVIIALPNMFIMAEHFYGTTVRYSLGTLLFVVFFLSQNRFSLFRFGSIAFHYGLFVPVFLDSIKGWYSNKFLSDNKYKQFFLFLFLVLLLFTSKYIVVFILPYTRFYYYLSSYYLEVKSLSSILYILFFWLLCMLAYKSDVSVKDDSLFCFSFTILSFCIISSGIAVLSGRVLLLFFVIEPLLIYKLARRKKTVVVALFMFILSLSKLVLYI